ncbi:hypothetical protein QTO01_00580 [Vibrio mytili]
MIAVVAVNQRKTGESVLGLQITETTTNTSVIRKRSAPYSKAAGEKLTV